jgi:hypothetical protein
MHGLLLYSILVIVALVLAAAVACVIKLLFIPGFEAWAYWPPLTIVLFIPCLFLVLRAMKAFKGTT